MTSIPQDERQARVLPIQLLADDSGSMGQDGKIDALNAAIDQLGPEFVSFKAKNPYVEVKLQVVRFGGDSATGVFPDWVSPEAFQWRPLSAHGGTPMGAAFTEAKRQFDQLGSSATHYPPVLCLVSDGQPTDKWESALAQLLSSAYGNHARCISIAIGADANRTVLGKFCERSEYEILEPANASQLIDAIVLSSVHASQAAVSRQSMMSVSGSLRQSMHSIAVGDLPEGSLASSIVDDASYENKLW